MNFLFLNMRYLTDLEIPIRDSKQKHQTHFDIYEKDRRVKRQERWGSLFILFPGLLGTKAEYVLLRRNLKFEFNTVIGARNSLFLSVVVVCVCCCDWGGSRLNFDRGVKSLGSSTKEGGASEGGVVFR